VVRCFSSAAPLLGCGVPPTDVKPTDTPPTTPRLRIIHATGVTEFPPGFGPINLDMPPTMADRCVAPPAVFFDGPAMPPSGPPLANLPAPTVILGRRSALVAVNHRPGLRPPNPHPAVAGGGYIYSPSGEEYSPN